jgi:hypothetical protein
MPGLFSKAKARMFVKKITGDIVKEVSLRTQDEKSQIITIGIVL